MARALPVNFDMVYTLSFESVIRGHHVYNALWDPEVGEMRECHEDTIKGAKSNRLSFEG